MKLNTFLVNHYLDNLSKEDQRELLEELLEHFSNSLSNISIIVLDYPKEKALRYMSEPMYHILHNLLPRNLFYTNEDIREEVKAIIPTLNTIGIQKVYKLLLKLTPMPNTSPSEIIQSALNPTQNEE